MALLPLAIPAGVVKNGTEFQQANSWNDANLIRWYEGNMQPVGGWRSRTTSQMTGLCRAIITYNDNSGNRRTVAGTHSKLYVIDESNTVHDITPTSFTAGDADAVQNMGYGGLTYGTNAWGTPRPDSGSYTPATTWSLAPWGEYALGCSSKDGKIYQWANATGTIAAVLSNAPTSNNAIVVTEERFVFALGASGLHNQIKWSDQENNNLWAAATTNQAGDFILNSGGELLAGYPMRGETLLLSTTDAHVARYQGPPFVYGFQKVGDGCGAISANACAIADGFAVWMGSNSFHIYDGSLRTLRCTVGDYLFTNLNESQRSKVFAYHNSTFDEVWWFYPQGNENSHYVAWNYSENTWTIGSLGRTAGVGQGIFQYPTLVTSDGYLYEHEVGFAYDDETVFAESGPIQLGNGDRLTVAKSLIPDESNLGDVKATFKTRNFPTGTETTHGPYTLANPTPVRFTGRQVQMRIEKDAGSDFRVGTMRLEVVEGSKR